MAGTVGDSSLLFAPWVFDAWTMTNPPPLAPHRIGILLFDGVDLLDAGGPYEVFLTASRLVERAGGDAAFEVLTISADGQPVLAYGGLQLGPTHAAADVGALDAIVIPGTIDLDRALSDQALLDLVAALDNASNVTSSVCTGSFLLAASGVLTDQPWTTHWEDIDDLAARLGPDGARRNVRWVESGRIVTAAGLTSGLDMALYLVARLGDHALAEQTARQIDYDWSVTPKRASGTSP